MNKKQIGVTQNRKQYKRKIPAEDNESNDPHLHSTDSVLDYHIHSTDGDIALMEDFHINIESWKINFLLIDTKNWIGGKKVLIPVRHVKGIKLEDLKINLGISTVHIINDEPRF